MKSPDDFGAVAGTDESAAVNAWAAAGGGEWPRSYRADRPVSFPAGMTLVGDLEASPLVIGAAAPPDTTMLWINGPCWIDGLRVDAKAYAHPSNADLVIVQGEKAHVDMRVTNSRYVFALAITGSGHQIDASFDGIVQGVWDGSVGTQFGTLKFRNTLAACYVAGGTDTYIDVLDAEDIGECVMMTSSVNANCRVRFARWRRVRRDPAGGDQGTGCELWGGWTFDEVDGADVDWSHFVVMDPRNVVLRGLTLRNPGQWSNAAVRPGGVVSVPEPGPDSSACVKLYSLNPGAKPSNIIIDYRLLTDDRGECSAITVLGAPGSPQIEDLYIIGSAAPGRWKNGQAIDVRQAETGGVTRSVCGPRCYHNNAALPSKPPQKVAA